MQGEYWLVSMALFEEFLVLGSYEHLVECSGYNVKGKILAQTCLYVTHALGREETQPQLSSRPPALGSHAMLWGSAERRSRAPP